MAGIIHKIGETLHVGGGQKTEEHKGEPHRGHAEGEHKPEHHILGGDHKPEQHGGEHKEGVVDKIKDKIHGGHEVDHGSKDKGDKKKKKDKKKHEHGHGHDGGSSSSSDSD